MIVFKNVFLHVETLFSSQGIKDICLHIFLCFCNQQNKCRFHLHHLSWSNIHTQNGRESPRAIQTDSSATHLYFIYYLYDIFFSRASIPGQPFKAFAPAVCTSSPSSMPWWSKTTSMQNVRLVIVVHGGPTWIKSDFFPSHLYICLGLDSVTIFN